MADQKPSPKHPNKSTHALAVRPSRAESKVLRDGGSLGQGKGWAWSLEPMCQPALLLLSSAASGPCSWPRASP